jgi:hypothetical protein
VDGRHRHDATGSDDHPGDPDRQGDDPSPAPRTPRMVWTTVALAMSPLLPAPPAPVAIGRAPPLAPFRAPLDVALPLPFARGPPA